MLALLSVGYNFSCTMSFDSWMKEGQNLEQKDCGQ